MIHHRIEVLTGWYTTKFRCWRDDTSHHWGVDAMIHSITEVLTRWYITLLRCWRYDTQHNWGVDEMIHHSIEVLTRWHTTELVSLRDYTQRAARHRIKDTRASASHYRLRRRFNGLSKLCNVTAALIFNQVSCEHEFVTRRTTTRKYSVDHPYHKRILFVVGSGRILRWNMPVENGNIFIYLHSILKESVQRCAMPH